MMFTSLGLFQKVECPNQEQCKLLACIFLHNNTIRAGDTQFPKYDPLSARYDEEPPTKRFKVEGKSSVENAAVVQSAPIKAEEPEKVVKIEKPQRVVEQVEKRAIAQSQEDRDETAQSVICATTVTSKNKPEGPIPPKTPPAAKRTTLPTSSIVKSKDVPKKLKPPKKEDLIPRSVPSQPVQFGKRDEILKKFYAQVQSKDKLVAGSDPELKRSMLSEQELIKYCLDVEQEAATKYEGTVYQSHLGRQMVFIKKLSPAEWKAFVRHMIRKDPSIQKPENSNPEARPLLELGSTEEQVAILRAIRTSLAGLDQFGYVTSAPTAQQIASAKAAIESCAGWEECNRCNTRFCVFPGRDEKGKLTSGGKCRYHWARPNRPQVSKADRMAGGGQILHPCCGQSPGSDGCTVAESHVFSVKDPSRLASILQFESTPVNRNAVKGAISFDCEMGYTTLGMEVIRVTAVSWPTGKELLDFLVRPYGEILDFNTRFSGVTPKQFANATAYGAESSTDCEDGALLKVDSPAAARQLLFDLISPETPLIGHAIDNDLNTLRIIHPLVVDTTLLYPHPKGLPVRFSLKVLAKQYLDRDIQTSGADGHDSKEDAITTGDLVTLKVQDKWKQMQVAGWKFENGKLAMVDAKMAKAPG